MANADANAAYARDVTSIAVALVDDARYLNRFCADAVCHALSADADALADGCSPNALAGAPLWPDGAPQWAVDDWRKLRASLSEPHWKPWLDWRQRCHDGEEFSEEIELLFATLPVNPREKDIAEQNEELDAAIERLAKGKEAP